MTNILLGFIGLCSGAAVSAGVFALVTALSLIPRMAVKTHTGKYVHTYEWSVFFGGMAGVTLYFLDVNNIPVFFLQGIPLLVTLLFSGIFVGMFVGTLAISLAENLDVTAILGRRIRLHQYFAWMILAFAIGKSLASLLFFYKRWY